MYILLCLRYHLFDDIDRIHKMARAWARLRRPSFSFRLGVDPNSILLSSLTATCYTNNVKAPSIVRCSAPVPRRRSLSTAGLGPWTWTTEIAGPSRWLMCRRRSDVTWPHLTIRGPGIVCQTRNKQYGRTGRFPTRTEGFLFLRPSPLSVRVEDRLKLGFNIIL